MSKRPAQSPEQVRQQAVRTHVPVMFTSKQNARDAAANGDRYAASLSEAELDLAFPGDRN